MSAPSLDGRVAIVAGATGALGRIVTREFVAEGASVGLLGSRLEGLIRLAAELDLIQRQAYIEQAARGVGLGGPTDHPFALAPGAPALAANAPGSAAMRLGAQETPSSPLEVWLSLLFGPPPSD